MASLLDLAQARLGGLLAPQRPSMAGLLGGQRTQGNLASVLQGYTPPQMTALTNPQVMDYARNVAQTAQQNLQTQMSDLDKALVMGQQGIQVGDREALARLMEQVPGLMGATAYHGTPHTIRGKFDISKVGTGEGAQSYGHGMYFAENPAVAKGYADKLGYDYQYAGKTPKEGSPTDFALRWLKNLNWDKEAAKAQWKNEGFGAKVIQAIDKVDLEKVKAPGNLYKVDIPDEYIPKMLNWDQPVPEELRKRISKATMEEFGNGATGTSGEFLYKEIVFEMRRKGSNTPEADAAKWLDSQGVKGIKYEDAGSRNKEGGKTFNYVVFDPTDVKILEKNSQKVEGLLD